MKDSITQQQLKKLLHYDRDTGIFTWKDGRSGIKEARILANVKYGFDKTHGTGE